MHTWSKTAKGLNIAIMILSIVGIVCCLLGMLFSVLLTAYVVDYGMGYTGSDLSDMAYALSAYGLSTEGIAAILFSGSAIIVLVLKLALLIFSLASSISGLRNCAKPDRATTAMVLAIINAVLCGLDGSWIICILAIISAIFLAKVRKLVPVYTA